MSKWVFILLASVSVWHVTSYKNFNDYGISDGRSRWIPWDEFYHNPYQVREWPELMRAWGYLLPEEVNSSVFKVPTSEEAPDFRLPEHSVDAYHSWDPTNPDTSQYKESGRYYRLTPRFLDSWRYYRKHEKPEDMNCYCVMVYKRLTPLAMGAVLTYRHILTSALATDVVLSKYKHKKTLENILGAWYNTDRMINDRTNTVYYMTPARIIYHPRWSPPELANRSHPIPCVFDLALWTSTKSFYYDVRNKYGYPYHGFLTALCQRWSNKLGYTSEPSPTDVLVSIVVGCQMVMDANRKPYPWFKYAVRHNVGSGLLFSCPKTDWEWFICLESNFGVKTLSFGAEPGAALHLVVKWDSWRFSGLAGINSFAMRLRSKFFVNYFTVLDRHPVLDWIYDAVKGRVPYAFLDVRFDSFRDVPISIKEPGGQSVGPTDKWTDPVEYRLKPAPGGGWYNPAFN